MTRNAAPKRIIGVLLLQFLFGGAALHAQTNTPAAPPTPSAARVNAWTPEDMVFFDVADQFRISPDGKWALWVKTVPDKKKDSRATQLMLSSMVDSAEIQLTREIDNVSQPRWSPDGKRIAFLSSRALPDAGAGKPHIWLINPFGGEPWPALPSDLRLKHFEWQDNDTIIFSAADDFSLYESQAEEKKDDTNVVDDAEHAPRVRLFRLSVKDKSVTRLTDNDRWIENFDISPDGKRAVFSESRELSYQWDRRISPAVWILNFATGERKQIFTEGNIHPRVLKWAADNSGIYAIAPFSNIMPEPSGFARLVYFYDVASGATSKVNLEWEKGVGFLQRFEVTPDGFVVLLADGVRFKPSRYTRHGATWSHEWLQGEHDRNYFNFTLGADARSIVYEYSTASTPWQWYRAQLDGAKVQNPTLLVDIYSRYRKKTIAKTEVIHWKGANDDEVDGILYYPDDYQSEKRYPLVTYTHGGPMGADLDAWSANPAYAANLLTQRGAFVLETNYHGSANYGAKWAESICCGKYYELEIPDIEKGVDSLIAKGLVDPDRIGAFGWSNGAILSTQLNVEDPQRYKATVVGAGDVEYVSDWGNSEYGEAFDNFYFGKSPFEDAELYIRKSPIYKLDRVRTPTLIMHGSIDQNVPTEQGWLHYRSLYYLQKAPVRFLLFPGEEHFPMKLSHQLRVTTEEMAWFDKYLFHANAPKNEALKDGSPLVDVLEHPIRKVGSRYGIEFATKNSSTAASTTILIPEVVSRGTFDLGRFEVTRAQYASFDKDYKYEPGAENYPASSISFEKAKAYCMWLSKLTGETYRLPNKDEAKTLYISRSGENTLDYWAGYSVNPDDDQKLDALISGLPPDTLLKPVGSFPGEAEPGEDSVFDLGGNVAEWVKSADGSGELSGGSADRPADPKAQSKPSRLSFAGFRVVREPSTSK
ncbi:MAG TPA: prolyl oligopeptidase family serine peptidase [Candidatus Acidoferrum sp.]|nr:prolyl oligopeptidase family serine peptidase [Candidatus Acidoferrum sp.]